MAAGLITPDELTRITEQKAMEKVREAVDAIPPSNARQARQDVPDIPRMPAVAGRFALFWFGT